jgi:hypothetical protein
MKINLNQIFELIENLSGIEDRHLLEFVAVLKGDKEVMRIHINKNEEYTLLEKFCKENSLLIGHSDFKLKVDWVNEIGDTFLQDVPWEDESAEMFVAYITKSNQDALLKALSIEVSGEHLDAGKLYGYPECCCINYEKISTGEFWINSLLDNSHGLFFKHWNNKLAYLVHNYAIFPDYFPCSFTCKGTEELSKQYYKLGLDSGLTDFVEKQIDFMSRTYLVSDDSVFSFKNYVINENTIILNTEELQFHGDNVFHDLGNTSLEIPFKNKLDNLYWYWEGIKFRALVFNEKYT